MERLALLNLFCLLLEAVVAECELADFNGRCTLNYTFVISTKR